MVETFCPSDGQWPGFVPAINDFIMDQVQIIPLPNYWCNPNLNSYSDCKGSIAKKKKTGYNVLTFKLLCSQKI